MTVTTETQKNTDLHTKYGISPEVARKCLAKYPGGGVAIEAARQSHLTREHQGWYTYRDAGWLAAMAVIATGDKPSYLLQEVMETIWQERKDEGLAVPDLDQANREIINSRLQTISAFTLRAYDGSATSQTEAAQQQYSQAQSPHLRAAA